MTSIHFFKTKLDILLSVMRPIPSVTPGRTLLILTFLFGLSVFPSFSYATDEMEIPKQFRSDNAATVLGLADHESVTRQIVKKAAQKLLRTYHPDKKGKTHYSQEQLTEISKKINTARDKLEKYLELHGEFNAKAGTTEASAQSRSSQTDDFYGNAPWNDSPFGSQKSKPWEDIFSDEFAPTDLSVYTGREPYVYLSETVFSGLPDDLEVLFIPMEISSLKMSFDGEILLILERNKFPMMEVRFYQKPKFKDQAPSLQETVAVEYRQRYHNVKPFSTTPLIFDAIVFSGETYILPKDQFKIKVTPLGGAQKGAYVASFLSNSLFAGFGRFSSTTFVVKESGSDVINHFMPRRSDDVSTGPPRNLSWQDVTIQPDTEPIRLGHQKESVPIQKKPKTVDPQMAQGKKQVATLNRQDSIQKTLETLYLELKTLMENPGEGPADASLRTEKKIHTFLKGYNDHAPVPTHSKLEVLDLSTIGPLMTDILDLYFAQKTFSLRSEITEIILNSENRWWIQSLAQRIPDGPSDNLELANRLIPILIRLGSEKNDFIPLETFLSGIGRSPEKWTLYDDWMIQILGAVDSDSFYGKEFLRFFRVNVLTEPDLSGFDKVLVQFLKKFSSSEVEQELVRIMGSRKVHELESSRLVHIWATALSSFSLPRGSTSMAAWQEIARSDKISDQHKEILYQGIVQYSDTEKRRSFYERKKLFKNSSQKDPLSKRLSCNRATVRKM